LPDETCRFLAADFDGERWAQDALAYIETCRTRGIPAALERSRSGEGGHVWIFFSEPVPAREARQLGAMLITETMERRPEIGFASYDRLFPSQNTMPAGGFGNLIALPLQRRAREQGNSLFVDDPPIQPSSHQLTNSACALKPRDTTMGMAGRRTTVSEAGGWLSRREEVWANRTMAFRQLPYSPCRSHTKCTCPDWSPIATCRPDGVTAIVVTSTASNFGWPRLGIDVGDRFSGLCCSLLP
jgi:hypothetical protein